MLYTFLHMSSCYVIQFDLKLAEKLRDGLVSQGFTLAQPQYTVFQAKKKNLSCTLYTSGKLMIQGKEKDEFIQYYLEPEILGTFSYGYEDLDIDQTPRIGIDESGKGDFFGPLCVAGVFAEGESIPNLGKIGVKDSKRLNDNSICKIASKIRKEYAYHVIRIGPKKYNELYEKFENLNLLLGWGHATVIEELVNKTGCERVIIDKFAAEHVVETALKRKKMKVMLTQKVRAEQDLVVAAASILARAAFVEGMEKLEKNYGQKLPKGASNATLQAGKKLVQNYGPDILMEVGKYHFKTRAMILELAL